MIHDLQSVSEEIGRTGDLLRAGDWYDRLVIGIHQRPVSLIIDFRSQVKFTVFHFHTIVYNLSNIFPFRMYVRFLHPSISQLTSSHVHRLSGILVYRDTRSWRNPLVCSFSEVICFKNDAGSIIHYPNSSVAHIIILCHIFIACCLAIVMILRQHLPWSWKGWEMRTLKWLVGFPNLKSDMWEFSWAQP